MSIFSDYAYGYLTDSEFQAACAREYRDDDWYEEDDEGDDEDGDDL